MTIFNTDPDLKFYIKFDADDGFIDGTTFIDRSSAGNDFTRIGPVDSGVGLSGLSEYGSGLITTTLSSSSGYLELAKADEATTIVGTGNLTVGCWFKNLQASTTVDRTVISKGGDDFADDRQIRLYNDGNKSTVRGENDIGTSILVAGSPGDLPQNTWVHFVARYEPAQPTSQLQIILDGVLQASGTLAPPLANSLEALGIGGHPLASTQRLSGVIDEAFWFDRALTLSEILDIRSNGIEVLTTENVSGTIGSYIRSQASQSGQIGYFSQSLVDNPSGQVGFYATARDAPSGTIGIYSKSQDNVSGSIGAFINPKIGGSGDFNARVFVAKQAQQDFKGTLTSIGASSYDFDSQVIIEKTSTYGFDATMEVIKNDLPPSAIIVEPSAPQTGFIPYNVSFIGSSVHPQSKAITRYTWYFPDTNTYSGGIETEHTFNNSGIFAVTLAVRDSDGVFGYDVVTIDTVSGQILMPNLAISGEPIEGSSPLEVQFGATPSSVVGFPVNTTRWNFGNGLTSLRQNPTSVYNKPGDYIPICTITDTRGVSVSDTIASGYNN
jgi:hypothetical protein